jgi:superfamily II DNA helicase RecQ
MALHVKTFRITDDVSEQAVNSFLQNKRVSQWTAAHTSDGWNLIIGYDEDRPRTVSTRSAAPVREKKEPKMEHIPDLPKELMGLYENIRKWRNQQAREEKVKPYIFFNNKQLEDIVKAKPSDLDALKAIASDMSPEHLEKYGNELLGVISAS